jgi:hypothetical protein
MEYTIVIFKIWRFILNMKSLKLFSLLMAVMMLCSLMVACGGNNEATETTTASLAPAFAATVSIKVVDMEGNEVINAANYSYQSGTTAPTAFAVLDDYCYMNFDNGEGMVKVDADGRLVSVGKVAAVDGASYWSITVNGKDISSTEFSSQELVSGDTVVITLKDSSQAKG